MIYHATHEFSDEERADEVRRLRELTDEGLVQERKMAEEADDAEAILLMDQEMADRIYRPSLAFTQLLWDLEEAGATNEQIEAFLNKVQKLYQHDKKYSTQEMEEITKQINQAMNDARPAR